MQALDGTSSDSLAAVGGQCIATLPLAFRATNCHAPSSTEIGSLLLVGRQEGPLVLAMASAYSRHTYLSRVLPPCPPLLLRGRRGLMTGASVVAWSTPRDTYTQTAFS